MAPISNVLSVVGIKSLAMRLLKVVVSVVELFPNAVLPSTVKLPVMVWFPAIVVPDALTVFAVRLPLISTLNTVVGVADWNNKKFPVGLEVVFALPYNNVSPFAIWRISIWPDVVVEDPVFMPSSPRGVTTTKFVPEEEAMVRRLL